MDLGNLVLWLRNPSLLDRDSLDQLRAILEKYPCFTVARTLYLKNLLVLEDLHFSKELIRTAVSVPDRRRMYYFVEDRPMPEPVYTNERELSEGEGFSIIDRFLHISDSDEMASEQPEQNPIGMEVEASDVEVQESDRESIRDLLDLPEADSVFSLDYTAYLSQTMTSGKEADRQEPENAMPGQDLIDAFLSNSSEIESNPVRLQKEDPVQAAERAACEPVDDEKASATDLPDDSFTETLAKIYLKQKRYDKALEIFKSLSLKYPEKNVYFADQIRYLEKLINNIKNN